MMDTLSLALQNVIKGGDPGAELTKTDAAIEKLQQQWVALRIGFLGLGTMGFPSRAGWRRPDQALLVYDPAARQVNVPFRGAGVSIEAGHSSGFMAHADVIMTCLPDERSIESVFLAGDVSLQRILAPAR